jgi:uncharacterized protein YyaL (SSP411 family)
MPSGNGVAARALQRLALLTGEQRYADAAERTLVLFYRELSHNASGFASLLMALDEWCTPCDIVILRGPTDALAAWRTALAEAGHARLKSLILALPNALNDLPPTLSKPISHTVNAWICQGVNCLPPVTELETLLKALCKPSKVK